MKTRKGLAEFEERRGHGAGKKGKGKKQSAGKCSGRIDDCEQCVRVLRKKSGRKGSGRGIEPQRHKR